MRKKMSVQRRVYDQEFKRNVVKLPEETGRNVTDAACNLGIAADLLS